MIPWAKPSLGPLERKYVNEALESTWISGGPFVERFERDFLSVNRARFGLTCSNGTTALHLALLAAGVGPGSEVIVPGFTFVAPAALVKHLGATPVFVDVDPGTWCIDPAKVEEALTPRTSAVITVHVYGGVCDMDALPSVLSIEDCAEAAFSRYKGCLAGTLGTMGCYSFQATKTITMGEGGFVISSSERAVEEMKQIRDHGMRPGKRYFHDLLGHNFRLTNMQAALGCAQLEQAGSFIDRRKCVYDAYVRGLDFGGVTLQGFHKDVDPVVWAVAVKLDPRAFPPRNEVIARMADAEIETRPGFYPFNEMPLYDGPALPVSMDLGHHVISLPTYPTLRDGDIEYICAQLKRLRR